MPAPSCPATMGSRAVEPARMCSSEWHSPAAISRTRTSPAFGGSRSTSVSSHLSPGLRSTAARVFIVLMFWPSSLERATLAGRELDAGRPNRGTANGLRERATRRTGTGRWDHPVGHPTCDIWVYDCDGIQVYITRFLPRQVSTFRRSPDIRAAAHQGK